VDGPLSFLGKMSTITWHGNVGPHLAHGKALPCHGYGRSDQSNLAQMVRAV